MIIKTKIVDITDVIKDCPSKLVQNNIKSGNRAYSIKLEKFKGLLGFEIQPNRRIGTELADVAKRFGYKGIIHSDELPGYGITEDCVKKIEKSLGCDKEDAFIMLFSKDEESARLVFEEIINRLNEMIKKVPKDTRQVNPDGTSMFLRPQPGSARMYPETDHPLIFIDKNVIEKEDYYEIIYRIKIEREVDDNIKLIRLKNRDIKYYLKNKKKLESEGFLLDKLDPEFRRKVLIYLGLDEKKIEQVIRSEYIDLFEDYYGYIEPKLIYYVIFQLKSEAEFQYKTKLEINYEFIVEALELLKDNLITRYGLIKLLYLWNKENKSLEELLDKYDLRKLKYEEVLEEVRKLYKKHSEDMDEKRLKTHIISLLKERADPKDIVKAIDLVKSNEE